MTPHMTLEVLLPDRVFCDEEALSKIVAEAADGSFGLLPGHVDFAAPLVPGLLAYTRHGEEHFVAVDGGVLVKCGTEVRVSTREAVRGEDLETLSRTVEERFATLDERERKTRKVLADLESSLVRRFVEMERRG